MKLQTVNKKFRIALTDAEGREFHNVLRGAPVALGHHRLFASFTDAGDGQTVQLTWLPGVKAKCAIVYVPQDPECAKAKVRHATLAFLGEVPPTLQPFNTVTRELVGKTRHVGEATLSPGGLLLTLPSLFSTLPQPAEAPGQPLV